MVTETDESALGGNVGPLSIPEMQATIKIYTGKKRALNYLMQPVLKAELEAFRKR